MSTVVYTKLKELEIQDKEIFEFGNWLKNFNEDSWAFGEEYYDEDEDQDDEEKEIPKNKKGEKMEYPWGDFSFIIVPDNDTHITESEKIAELLGLYERFDVEDSDRTFFVVK